MKQEVADDEFGAGVINLGSTVTVYDCEFDEELVFKLVGSTEAKSLENKISNEAPLGKALIGKVAGDEVEVETPSGIMKYKVINVTRE